MVGFASRALSSVASSLWVGVGPDNAGWHGIGGCAGSSDIGMVSFGVIMGGAGASLTGGNFWQGAATGLVVSGLNHLAHSGAESMTDEGDGDPPVKMKPASSYDYSQGTIDGKFTDDWNYILNGGKGNPFSRYGEIFARDWNASSTSQKTDLALSATPLALVRVGSLGLKTVSFGRNANQTYHAFRHVDDLGLSRNVVIKAIEKHLPSVISKVKVGQPLNVITKINNTRIQYSVYKVGNSYNIGRIHAAF